jgi:hypothetical protein
MRCYLQVWSAEQHLAFRSSSTGHATIRVSAAFPLPLLSGTNHPALPQHPATRIESLRVSCRASASAATAPEISFRPDPLA